MGTSTDANPTYQYTQPGVYDVTLTVYGLGGTTSYTRTGYITVTTPTFNVTLGSVTPTGSATVTGMGSYTYNSVGTIEAFQAGGQPYADVIFLVAQPLSMSSYVSAIQGLVAGLEAELTSQGMGIGADPNQYALVGFENGSTLPADTPTKRTVGGGDWGTSAELSTALGLLPFPFTAASQSSDGYYACEFALANYTFRAGAPKVFVIISNEERRDITSGATTEATFLSAMTAGNVICNFLGMINLSATPVNFADNYGRKGTTSVAYYETVSAPFYGSKTFTAWQNPVGTRNTNVITTYVAAVGSLSGDAWCFTDFGAETGFINAFSDTQTAHVVEQAGITYGFGYFVLNNGSNIATNPYMFNVVEDTVVDVYMGTGIGFMAVGSSFEVS